MKISEASNIYVGRSAASAVYLGADMIWPTPDVYFDYSTNLHSNWGHHVPNGSNLNLTGNYWVGLWDGSGHNITGDYNWNATSNITQVDIERMDNSDPTSRVLNYKLNISGPATLTITDKNDNTNVKFRVKFNS